MCPGEQISLTCTHDNVAGEQTRWQMIQNGNSTCTRVVSHTATQREELCGDSFTIFMISDNSGPTLNTTLQTTATESLEGTIVVCYAGGLSTSPQAWNVTIHVIG